MKRSARWGAMLSIGLLIAVAVSRSLPAGEPQTESPSARSVRLAEPVDPASLQRMLTDAAGTFDLIDIRPADQFADYRLPGAVNVDIGQLLGDDAVLKGTSPLVLVDRDGSLAMMVGGILSQKTDRPIKVLHGGLSAYWTEREWGSLIARRPTTPSVRPAPAAAPARAAATPSKPTKPTKRSAGC